MTIESVYMKKMSECIFTPVERREEVLNVIDSFRNRVTSKQLFILTPLNF